MSNWDLKHLRHLSMFHQEQDTLMNMKILEIWLTMVMHLILVKVKQSLIIINNIMKEDNLLKLIQKYLKMLWLALRHWLLSRTLIRLLTKHLLNINSKRIQDIKMSERDQLKRKVWRKETTRQTRNRRQKKKWSKMIEQFRKRTTMRKMKELNLSELI